jgi:hypothetical protein
LRLVPAILGFGIAARSREIAAQWLLRQRQDEHDQDRRHDDSSEEQIVAACI